MTTDAARAGASVPETAVMARIRARRRLGVPRRRHAAIGHAILATLSIFCLFPVYWMAVTSLRPANAIFEATLWPASPSLASYAAALQEIPVLQMLANTFIVSTLVTVLQLFTGVLAAYAFACWRFRLDRLAFSFVSLTWLIPLQVVMIPNYLLVAQLGLLDSLTALVLPHFASALAVMLLAQAMRSFPREVLEAARIDGAGSWRVLWQVIVPNLGGSIASLAILVFVSTWNEYFWPLLLSRTPENSVIQIGIQSFMTEGGNDWGPLMAASTMATAPILVFYLILQRQVVQSFMRSGGK